MAAFTGLPADEKLSLVKALVMLRVKGGGLIGRLLSSEKSLDEAALPGTPEATVVSVLEKYYAIRGQGVDDAAAFPAVEAQSPNPAADGVPKDVDIAKYLAHRVRREHGIGHRLSENEILRAISITSGVIERFVTGSRSDGTAAPAPPSSAATFAADLPAAETPPMRQHEAAGLRLEYYENLITPGASSAGIELPQVILVSDQGRPWFMVRVERAGSGQSTLGVLHMNGAHIDFGPFKVTDADAFIQRALDLIRDIRGAGRA